MTTEESEQPTFLEYAGQECKIMIRKAWKAKLEGGYWAALPFDWSALSEEERALVTLPEEELTPFALVGPAVWSSTDFATVLADTTTFVFAYDASRTACVLSSVEDEGYYHTKVQVDEMPFKLANPPKKKKKKS